MTVAPLVNQSIERIIFWKKNYVKYKSRVKTFLARLHFSAEELLLYPRRQRPRQRRRQRPRRRPHAKC